MSPSLPISMFDFGGQEVFNVVHSLFLTKYALYLVVFNMDRFLTSEDPSKIDAERGIVSWDSCTSRVEFWVSSVAARTMDKDSNIAPIFIVGTHKDVANDKASFERMSEGIFGRPW